MNTVEAIHVVKTKKPDEVSAEELADLRALLVKMPSLVAALGGRAEVDRFLAEAEAAGAVRVRVKKEMPPSPAVEQLQSRTPRVPRRRVIEFSLYAALVAVGVIWFYSMLTRGEPVEGASSQGALANDRKSAHKSTPDKLASSQARPGSEASLKSNEISALDNASEGPGLWRGWKIEAQGAARSESKIAWDLTDSDNLRPVRQLVTSGGRIALSARRAIPANARSLKIDCRQVDPAPNGEVKMLINGRLAATARVPSANSGEPLLMTLGPVAGTSVEITLIHTAGANEQVAWRNISFSPESADVMAASGEPDPKKASLRLWLRADAGIKDTAGRRPGEGGYDNFVKTWDDQSSHGFHFAGEGGDAARPAYTAHHAGLAAKPAVSFDGQKQFLRCNGDNIYRGAASTTFAVVEAAYKTLNVFETSPPAFALVVDGRTVRTGGKGRHRNRTTSVASLSFAAPNRIRVDMASHAGHFVIAALQTSGSASFIELNGAGRIAGHQTGGNCGNSFILGAPPPAPPAPPSAPPPGTQPPAPAFGGSLAELIIYDRALSPYEIRQIGQYLQAKYGIVGSY